MEYVKGQPYFCHSKNKIKRYHYLNKNLDCEVLIIGGGIDGAILNYYLSQSHDVALVDKSRIGMGCTSCATALLEYQLDEFANDLTQYLSREEIVQIYKMGQASVDKIVQFIDKHGNHCEFTKRPTLLYTGETGNKDDLMKEYEFRINNGFDVELITPDNNPYSFKIEAGILAEDGGCEFNPYLFTKQMIESANNQDKIFENTDISQLIKTEHGYKAITTFGEEITCRKVIIATGFNFEILNNEELCERFITYTIVTNPIEDFSWHKKTLIHDATDPYHYLRLLPNKRIIFGGEDKPFKMKPIDEKTAEKTYKKLHKSLIELFPEIKDKIKIDYQFCGAFGTTSNNLGLIGESKIDKNILLFISCGANGIINAFAGAEIIESILNNQPHPLLPLFSPMRENI